MCWTHWRQISNHPEASESDTDEFAVATSEKIGHLESTPQLQQPDEQVDSRGAVLFVPEEIGMRRGLESLDMVDIAEVFSIRAMVMKSVPRFLAGAFRGCVEGRPSGDLQRQGSEQCGGGGTRMVEAFAVDSQTVVVVEAPKRRVGASRLASKVAN